MWEVTENDLQQPPLPKFTTVFTKRVRSLGSRIVVVQKPQAEVPASPREVLQTATGLAPTAFAPLQWM